MLWTQSYCYRKITKLSYYSVTQHWLSLFPDIENRINLWKWNREIWICVELYCDDVVTILRKLSSCRFQVISVYKEHRRQIVLSQTSCNFKFYDKSEIASGKYDFLTQWFDTMYNDFIITDTFVVDWTTPEKIWYKVFHCVMLPNIMRDFLFVAIHF